MAAEQGLPRERFGCFHRGKVPKYHASNALAVSGQCTVGQQPVRELPPAPPMGAAPESQQGLQPAPGLGCICVGSLQRDAGCHLFKKLSGVLAEQSTQQPGSAGHAAGERPGRGGAKNQPHLPQVRS